MSVKGAAAMGLVRDATPCVVGISDAHWVHIAGVGLPRRQLSCPSSRLLLSRISLHQSPLSFRIGLPAHFPWCQLLCAPDFIDFMHAMSLAEQIGSGGHGQKAGLKGIVQL